MGSNLLNISNLSSSQMEFIMQNYCNQTSQTQFNKWNFFIPSGCYFTFLVIWTIVRPLEVLQFKYSPVREEIMGTLMAIVYCFLSDMNSVAAIIVALFFDRMYRMLEYQENESTWVKQFIDPWMDATRRVVSSREIVSLERADIFNGTNPRLNGTVKVRMPQYFLHRGSVQQLDLSQTHFQSEPRRSSLVASFDESANVIVSVHYKCCMEASDEDINFASGTFKTENATFTKKNDDQCIIYSFDIVVPKNTSRFMKLKFFVECNVNGSLYHDCNGSGNRLYVFASEGMLGRIKRICNQICACAPIRRIFRRIFE